VLETEEAVVVWYYASDKSRRRPYGMIVVMENSSTGMGAG